MLSVGDIRKIVEVESEIPEKRKDEMAIPSYLHSNPAIRWLMWKRYSLIGQLINASQDAAILEFGCGLGLFLPDLCERAKTVYAVDLEMTYAKNLCKIMNLNVSFIDSVSQIPDQSLDCIVAADVMEHLDDPALYAREFSRKLRTGGQLIISGPTENHLYRIGRIMAGFRGKGDYHHFNIDTLDKLIRPCGFDLTRAKGLPANLPPYLFKVLVYKLN
jgi:2-polyprenyl-3-methyl-5-hydroxy-6-metoxy-1,4-benzoquinol methylase